LTSQPDQVQIKPLGDRRQRISTTFETQPPGDRACHRAGGCPDALAREGQLGGIWVGGYDRPVHAWQTQCDGL